MKAEHKIMIREATSKDVGAIVNVLKSTKLSNGAWVGDEEWMKRALAKALDMKNYTVLVAECNHKIVGFIDYIVFPSFWECSDQGLINHLFVHEASQNRGIGTRLVESVVDRADADGLSEMHVSTERENKKARRLYRKHGFTQEQLLLERSREK